MFMVIEWLEGEEETVHFTQKVVHDARKGMENIRQFPNENVVSKQTER
jgi:hypothetical protein